MSLSPPAYLSSLQSNIRARPIPWDGAVRAGNLTEDQLKKIKSVDKVRKDQRKQTIEKDVQSYGILLAGGSAGGSVLEKASKRSDILQYILVLATDLINDAPELATAILKQQEPYKYFLSLLSHSNNPEDPIPLFAATFLVNLIAISLTTSPKPAARDDQALPQLYSYLSKLIKNQDSGLQDIGVQHTSQLLRTQQAKALFWKQKNDTVDPLFDILRKAVGAAKDNDSTLWNGNASIRSSDTRFGGGVGLQLMYHCLLVIWQLSFEGELVGEGLEKDQEIIPLYIQLLRVSPKEKTTRLLLATLNNLLSANKESLIATATTARLPALLNNLSGRHLTDADLLEDLEALKTLLDEYTRNQTTFDEYADEVNSGHLRWSPPHRNPTFWRENARKILEEKKGELPKKLAEILAKSWENDKKVLAIGCNDLGHLVKEVPEQRTALEKLGLKARLLELMSDPDEHVRWVSKRQSSIQKGRFALDSALSTLSPRVSPPTDFTLKPTEHFSATSIDGNAQSLGSLASHPPPPSLRQQYPSLQRLPSLSSALKPFSPSSPVKRKPLPPASIPVIVQSPLNPGSQHQAPSSIDPPASVPHLGRSEEASRQPPSPPRSQQIPPDENPLSRTLTNGSLPENYPGKITTSPVAKYKTRGPNGLSLDEVAVEEDMVLKPGSRPPPLRTDSSSSNKSLTVIDSKKPTTPGSKFTSFFSRKPVASPSSDSIITDISDRRSPLASPYAGSPHASTHFSGGSLYGGGGPRQGQSQSSQDSIDFDRNPNTRTSYHSDSAQKCIQLESELREISTELANSIKREMDLEDLVDRLQTEGTSAAREPDRTSDYFSDSGTSSIRPPTVEDPKEEIARVKRESEQLRAQLKVEMSQKWQTERSSRQALEAHIQILEQRLSQDRRDHNQSLDISTRAKELEVSLEDARRRLVEERQTKENFEDLLTALRVELEQHRNDRDNLRDEIVPQLRSQIEGLEQNLSESQKSPYEVSRLQQELQSLRDENAALHSARAMNMQFQSISEEGDVIDGQRNQVRNSGLQRSSTIHTGKAGTRGTPNRSNSLSRSNSIINRAVPESQQSIADQLKDVTQQRDALHVTVKYLLRRQENQRQLYEKKIRLAEADRDQAKASKNTGKGGYEREVRTLRSEINLLRKRADDALEQKWQCEKGLAGLKMDLDRSKQETSSLQTLLQTRDDSAPEVLSSTLEKALKELQLQRDQARQHEALGSLEQEQGFADELEKSAQRSEELAAQVRQQMSANTELRGRLKEAITKGEANQAASAGQINELQIKLRKLEDVITVAQMQSETAVMKHEEEVRVLRASNNFQLMRSASGRKASGLLTPNLPRSPISPMFVNSKKSPRLDQTTSGPGINLQQALKTEYLENKVADLEKALAEAEKEMEEVVGRMNTAQIGVAELESERDEALRQTRRLEAAIVAEREKVQTLIDLDYSYSSDF